MTVRIAGVELDRGTIPLWAGVLGSPLLWAVQFQLAYMLVPWVCTNDARWLIPAVHVTFFALSAVGGLLSWREWRRLGTSMPPSQEEERAARMKFLAAMGVMSAALFSLLILSQAVASFFLDACWA